MPEPASTPPAVPSDRRPPPDEISRRAHALWREAGSPEGSSREHWLQAERELAESAAESEEQPTTPYGASGSSSVSGQG